MKIPEPAKGRLKHPLDPRDQERLHWKGRGVVSFSSPSPRLAWCHTDRVPWAYGVTSEKRKSKLDIQSPSTVEHFPVSPLGSSHLQGLTNEEQTEMKSKAYGNSAWILETMILLSAEPEEMAQLLVLPICRAKS